MLDRPDGQDDGDLALLAGYANGDVAAARELAKRLTPMLMSYAMRTLRNRDDAEDVVQEAMLRLWKAAPGWKADGSAKVSTWVYRVVVNLCIDRLRRSKKSVDIEAVAEPADPSPGVADKMQDTARLAALDEALGQLPARQAQAVSLRHLEGLANPEIAEIMGIGVEAVESLTARGKRKLSELLGRRKKELGYGNE